MSKTVPLLIIWYNEKQVCGYRRGEPMKDVIKRIKDAIGIENFSLYVGNKLYRPEFDTHVWEGAMWGYLTIVVPDEVVQKIKYYFL
jgi:hypothetical protein